MTSMTPNLKRITAADVNDERPRRFYKHQLAGKGWAKIKVIRTNHQHADAIVDDAYDADLIGRTWELDAREIRLIGMSREFAEKIEPGTTFRLRGYKKAAGLFAAEWESE